VTEAPTFVEKNHLGKYVYLSIGSLTHKEKSNHPQDKLWQSQSALWNLPDH
jgi:hypothetical protein